MNPKKEGVSLDKGYDGIQGLCMAFISVKEKKGIKRTLEEKENSNRLKKQRIIIENTINAIKQFKILKGQFLYPIEESFYTLRLDRVVRICASLTNLNLKHTPLR